MEVGLLNNLWTKMSVENEGNVVAVIMPFVHVHANPNGQTMRSHDPVDTATRCSLTHDLFSKVAAVMILVAR